MDDRTRIERLGGPARVAEMLGYEKEGGTQRVHNWLTRGIPPKVKLERPDLFIQPLPETRAAASDIQRETARRIEQCLNSRDGPSRSREGR
jgi:hypothetical protein